MWPCLAVVGRLRPCLAAAGRVWPLCVVIGKVCLCVVVVCWCCDIVLNRARVGVAWLVVCGWRVLVVCLVTVCDMVCCVVVCDVPPGVCFVWVGLVRFGVPVCVNVLCVRMFVHV